MFIKEIKVDLKQHCKKCEEIKINTKKEIKDNINFYQIFFKNLKI